MSKFKVTGTSWRPVLVSTIYQECIMGISSRIWTTDMIITFEFGLKLPDRMN